MNTVNTPYPNSTDAAMGDQIEMFESLVQPIQNSDTGIATEPPSIANHSRNSGGSRSPPASLIAARSRFAQ